MVVAVANVEAAGCSMVNTADSSRKTGMIEDVAVKLGVIRRFLAQRLCKLVGNEVRLRKLIFQVSKFTYSCLCCLLCRRLQNVNSVISCRSGICC